MECELYFDGIIKEKATSGMVVFFVNRWQFMYFVMTKQKLGVHLHYELVYDF